MQKVVVKKVEKKRVVDMKKNHETILILLGQRLLQILQIYQIQIKLVLLFMILLLRLLVNKYKNQELYVELIQQLQLHLLVK